METVETNKKETAGPEVEAKKQQLVTLYDIVNWLKDQVPLVYCAFVALSIHVVFLPMFWIVGSLLPWPESPIKTTIIEYDLTNWPRVAKPRKVLEIYDPDLNK